jgi:putative methyltransferase
MKRIKIAFINPPHADWSLINPVTWMLCKSFYQHNGKYADQVEWLEPPYKYNKYQNIEEIYELIKEADIVMYSSYVWNYTLCDSIAEYVKKQNPKVVNLLGGPMIGAKDKELWQKRWMYDYILRPMFPGEFFVTDVIDQYIEDNIDFKQITYELRSDKQQRWEFPLASPYEENLEFLKELSAYGREHDMELMMVIETTRGCPFKCTYCEWGGGIGGKITKKEVEWAQRDCVAIVEAGYTEAICADANFGVFEERDLGLLKFAKDAGLTFIDISQVKTKDYERRKRLVDSFFEIIQPFGRKDRAAIVPNISIQSISDVAMQVAKRTDMKVSDKIKLGKYMRDLCAKYDYHPGMELIMAMPGSTLDDFYAEWELFYDLGAWSSWRYDLMALPDSEISDPVYQEIYNIELVDVYTDNVDEQDIANQGGLFKNRRTYYKTVASSYSFTREDVVQMFFMNFAGNNLIRTMYDMFKDTVTVSEFAKHCWEIFKILDGYQEIYDEIEDILNPDTPPRNINTIKGVVRTEAIPRWVEENKLVIMNELFRRIT